MGVGNIERTCDMTWQRSNAQKSRFSPVPFQLKFEARRPAMGHSLNKLWSADRRSLKLLSLSWPSSQLWKERLFKKSFPKI